MLHFTANDGDTAPNNGNYFSREIVEASAHYFVDDYNVVQSVDDLRIAYAVGGSRYKNYKKTGGAKMYGTITNVNSLSVEMCDTLRNGVILATEATIERTIKLCAALMMQYDIPIENVYRHFDVTGKACPAYLVDNAAWERFKDRLEEEVFIMNINSLSDEQVLQLAERMQGLLGQKMIPYGAVLRPEFEAAQKDGITDGTKPYAFCTRIQTAVMIERAVKKLLK